MSPSKDIGPYASEPQSASVLEMTTVLSEVLRPAGYGRDLVNDLAVGTFVENERTSIKSPSTMHLLAIKKALLYAIPVCAPPTSNIGIALTSQVSSPAIQYESKKNKATKCALAMGDKFRLIGFAFNKKLINHLSYDIFPWKFFNTLSLDYTPSEIDLSEEPEFETKTTTSGKLHILKNKYYEDVDVFNRINQMIAMRLNEMMTSVLALKRNVTSMNTPTLQRIDGFNKNPFIKQLNAILPRCIDQTYTWSFYEALQMTANWLLYDQIELLGVESPQVSAKLADLAYVKDQKLKVQANMREITYNRLLETRAENIARQRYPYYFDYTDRRSIFTKFNRFTIDKLPQKDQAEVKTLLDKELLAQKALLNNKCEHIHFIKKLHSGDGEAADAYKSLEQYINYDSIDEGNMYSCKLCTYPLLCVHEVSLYDTIASIDKENDNSDQLYWARQKVINQYKLVDQRRTGEEDTEVSFTYYCKHCGGELGKSDDIIQSTIQTNAVSNSMIDSDPIDTTIFSSIYTIVNQFMNHSIVPMSKKAIVKLLYDETQGFVHQHLKFATKSERDSIDVLIKYLSFAYSMASLISININKLKSSESILILKKQTDSRHAEPVSGGLQLKDEMLSALKVIQSVSTFKSIGITDDKTKALLIEALKAVNRTFSSETFEIKAKMPRDHLSMNIRTSPIASYAKYMYRRQHLKQSDIDIFDVTGISLDALFPKGKQKYIPSTHALYANIYQSKAKETTDYGKYKQESYQQLVQYLTSEPIIGKYTSNVTTPPSDFALSFEKGRIRALKAKRTVPYRFLPVENGREYNFDLQVYQIGYCLMDNGDIRPHRWSVTKEHSKLIFTCKHCNLTIDKVSKSNNDKIDERLDERMVVEAFFELYTISCPIKDAHVFESNVCIQCNVTKDQLSNMDPKYYKKYSSTYFKHRDSITKNIIEDAGSIISYSSPLHKRIEFTPNVVKLDLVKLESLATSISKLYNYKDLDKLGIVKGVRSLEIVQSYVRLFYSHYTFAKNACIDMKHHPDHKFFRFIKEQYFSGMEPKPLNLPTLGAFPSNQDADSLLIELLQIAYNAINDGNNDANKLINFIIGKIVDQDMKRKEFNFAKLKALNTSIDDDDVVNVSVADDEDDEFDMFDGYDISTDDMEDNIDGDYD